MAGFVIDRVRPDQVTEEATFWDFSESVDLFDVIKLDRGRDTVLSSGEMPPWRSKNLRLTRQAKGRQSNISMTNS